MLYFVIFIFNEQIFDKIFIIYNLFFLLWIHGAICELKGLLKIIDLKVKIYMYVKIKLNIFN